MCIYCFYRIYDIQVLVRVLMIPRSHEDRFICLRSYSDVTALGRPSHGLPHLVQTLSQDLPGRKNDKVYREGDLLNFAS